MTPDILEYLARAIDVGNFSIITHSIGTLRKEPANLLQVQELVAQKLASYAVEGQDFPFAAALGAFASHPELLKKVKPETIARAINTQVEKRLPSYFTTTLAALKSTPALLSEVMPETLARGMSMLLQKRETYCFSKALESLAAHPPLYSKVQEAAAQQGLFFRPASRIRPDKYGRSYYLALKANDDNNIRLSSGCHADRDLAGMLTHWATSTREVTPDRRTKVIPVVMQLLDAAATGQQVPDDIRAAASRARDDARTQLAEHGIHYKPPRSDGWRRRLIGAVKRGLGYGSAG